MAGPCAQRTLATGPRVLGHHCKTKSGSSSAHNVAVAIRAAGTITRKWRANGKLMLRADESQRQPRQKEPAVVLLAGEALEGMATSSYTPSNIAAQSRFHRAQRGLDVAWHWRTGAEVVRDFGWVDKCRPPVLVSEPSPWEKSRVLTPARLGSRPTPVGLEMPPPPVAGP